MESTKQQLFSSRRLFYFSFMPGFRRPSWCRSNIKTYKIIYELFEELEEVSKLLKEKEESEKNLKGEAKILATFIIEGERIFGAKVTKGKVNAGDSLEVYRDGRLLNKTRLVSLRIRAKSVTEVKRDQECGMILSPPLDIKIGDMVKSIS